MYQFLFSIWTIVMRQEILKIRRECNQGEQKLKTILAKKMKKFTPEEVQTKSDSV